MLTLIAMSISNQFTGINRNLQYDVDAVKLFLAEQIESTAITPAVEAEVLDDKAKSARNGGKRCGRMRQFDLNCARDDYCTRTGRQTLAQFRRIPERGNW